MLVNLWEQNVYILQDKKKKKYKKENLIDTYFSKMNTECIL